MLALYALPALLGIAFLVGLFDSDGDDNEETEVQPPEEPPVQVPDDVDRFGGTSGDDNIQARDAGGFINAFGGDDTVSGSDNRDEIAGKGGDDVISSFGGDDIAWGDDGNDVLDMGDGNDRGIGGPGDDTLRGGAGEDEVSGDQGNDVVYGGDGNDKASGGYGDDLVYMGDGDDTNETYGYSGWGDDTVYGGAGNDTIIEGAGNDLIFGEEGDDDIRVHYESPEENNGLQAADTVDGGAGDDIIVVNGGDIVTGGDGADIIRILNEDAPFAPTIITDFDPSEDVLQITDYSAELPDPDDFSFEYDAPSNSVLLLRGETTIARLQGLEESDVPNLELVAASPFT